MKIITWNCNGAFRKKFRVAEELQADLMVIQECENPVHSTQEYRSWASNFLWRGENKNKGIGVFARANIDIEPLDWQDNGLQSFLPCKVNNSFTLLAVWTKHANSPNFRYIGQFWKYMQIHKENLKKINLLICGDLNSNVCWDEWDRWWNHSDVVKELEEIGSHSIYHHFYNEKQGKETKPTLFHRRNLEKMYHVDYVFATKGMFDKEKNKIIVGEHHRWLEFSDHMPIFFTINC